MAHPLIDQVRFTRAEWLRALRGVSEEDGSRKIEPINTIGWTVGHLAWQEQLYFLTRACGQTPEPILNELAASGGPPSTPSLKQMMRAWKNVTAQTDSYMDPLATADLLRVLPPPGRKRTVGDAIRRMTYHYWFHIGEILALRQLMDHPRRPEYVGNIEDMAPYRAE
jgi:DinB superfamily